MKNKILVIDDEESILHLLRIYLEDEGFFPILAASADEAITYMIEIPDLIILDVNMPGISGIEFCAKIRDFVNCPIIFLSGCVTQHDKIAGLQAGGDDYLLKPVDMEELMERIKAHLRRDRRASRRDQIKIQDDLVVEFQQRKIYWKKSEIILSNKEYQILELLIKNSGIVMDRERIYERIWGYDSNGDSIVVKEHIRKIRNKLQRYGLQEKIETVWGVGYRWKK